MCATALEGVVSRLLCAIVILVCRPRSRPGFGTRVLKTLCVSGTRFGRVI